MTAVDETKNEGRVLEIFANALLDARSELFKQWHDVHQTGDLAWTLADVLAHLQQAEDVVAERLAFTLQRLAELRAKPVAAVAP